jgi:hypothetical protein
MEVDLQQPITCHRTATPAKGAEDIMSREETMNLGQLREKLSRYPDDAQLFFGCPDEASPLGFVGIEESGDGIVNVKFRLNVYKGRD